MLPRPDDPLMLPDGRLVRPSGSVLNGLVEVPSNSQAQRIVASTQRKLADLPGTPKQLNALSAVLVYTLNGLSDAEISVATGLAEDRVRRIRDTVAYQQFQQNIVDAVKAQTGEAVTAILAEGEKKAATKIVELIDAPDDKIKLAAAKDVLDRRGHKPKEVVRMEGDITNTFRIEIVDKTATADIPAMTIDVE